MGLVTKTITLGCACVGLAAASQLPEFAQQYRQRLAGAVEELRVVVSDFDKDAENSGVTRKQALDSLSQSKEKFPRERGISIRKTISRFEALEQQQNSIEKAEPVSRPLFMLSSPDEALLRGTWEIFEPAVPLNAPGAMWGGFGALIFGFLARIPIGLSGAIFKRRNKIRVEPEFSPEPIVTDKQPTQQASAVLSGPIVGKAESPRPPAQSLLDEMLADQKSVGKVNAKGRLVRKDPDFS